MYRMEAFSIAFDWNTCIHRICSNHPETWLHGKPTLRDHFFTKTITSWRSQSFLFRFSTCLLHFKVQLRLWKITFATNRVCNRCYKCEHICSGNQAHIWYILMLKEAMPIYDFMWNDCFHIRNKTVTYDICYEYGPTRLHQC